MSTPDICPICEGLLRQARVRAHDRLITGEGPFGVRECLACRYGVTALQLSGEQLAPYDAESYYEDFYEQRHLYRGRWCMLDMPRHLQHFSPRALTRLGQLVGLELRAVGTNSNAITTAYSVHHLIAGSWTPGWKLWRAYALSLSLLPFVWLGDRLGGGDSCYAVMARSA